MKKVKKNRGITTLKDKYGRMFTTPWLIGIILFYLLPLAQSVLYSFADVKIKLGGMDISLVGLKNYKNILFVNPNYTGWLRSTVTSFLYSLPIILLLSLVLALILNQNFRGRLFFRALYCDGACDIVAFQNDRQRPYQYGCFKVLHCGNAFG